VAHFLTLNNSIEEGRGKREEGSGKREEGSGKRERLNQRREIIVDPFRNRR